MDSEIVIAVMGATGTGKSTFINLVSGSHLAVSHTLYSCTTSVQQGQTYLQDGRMITLVDTPGFDDAKLSDTDVLRMLAVYLASTYENGFKLNGILYLQRISDNRIGGISRRNFRMFRELCGEDTLRNVTVVTTMWNLVTEEKGAARERELRTSSTLMKPVFDNGARLLRHDNTLESAQSIIADVYGNTPRALRIQEELIDERRDITQTSAGLELHRELLLLKQKREKELKAIMKRLEGAAVGRTPQLRDELASARGELEGRIRALEVDLDEGQLSVQYSQEKEALSEEIRRVAEEYHAERQCRLQYEREVQRLQAVLDGRRREGGGNAPDAGGEQAPEAEGGPRKKGKGVFHLIGSVLDVFKFKRTR